MSKESQKWYKKTWFRSSAVAILGLLVIFLIANDKNGHKFEIIKMSRGTVVEEVMVSGTVKAGSAVNLAFEKSGRLQLKNKKIGDRVSAGELIMALDSSGELASLEDAKARLKSEEARLAEVKRGSRPEEILVKQSEYDKAGQDLKNYYESVAKYISDAYNKSDDSVNRQTDDLFSNDQSANPEITFPVGDQQNKTVAKEERVKAGVLVGLLKKTNDIALSSPYLSASEKKKLLEEAITHVTSIQTALVKINNVLDDAIGPSATVIATYKGYMSTARTNVNTALKSLSDLNQNINSQSIYLEKISRELDLIKAGPTAEAITQAESAVEIARASVKLSESNYRKNFIYSPIAGLITSMDAEIGEIIPANQKISSVINDRQFEIESLVSESDVIKIAVGNMATATLDAYGDAEKFGVIIISIDPAEKIVDGVPTYKTTLVFTDKEEKIRSGLTANVSIVSAKKDDVWRVPQKAIKKYNDEDLIYVVAPANATQTINGMKMLTVKTGIRGSDGFVEIIGAEEVARQAGMNPENLEVILNPAIPAK